MKPTASHARCPAEAEHVQARRTLSNAVSLNPTYTPLLYNGADRFLESYDNLKPNSFPRPSLWITFRSGWTTTSQWGAPILHDHCNHEAVSSVSRQQHSSTSSGRFNGLAHLQLALLNVKGKGSKICGARGQSLPRSTNGECHVRDPRMSVSL
jgi:hypothetical protein